MDVVDNLYNATQIKRHYIKSLFVFGVTQRKAAVALTHACIDRTLSCVVAVEIIVQFLRCNEYRITRILHQ